MALRSDWAAGFDQNGIQVISVSAVCPHCDVATTFKVIACHLRGAILGTFEYHLILMCEHTPCRKYVHVITTKRSGAGNQDRDDDSLLMIPSGQIKEPHPAIPKPIAEDWLEAQRSCAAGAIKAAAVMCRRVLYGVLMDKGCLLDDKGKERPLHEALKQLSDIERLPKVVNDWLKEIREDGNDAAHPSRALQVAAENVTESLDYTKELLRFVYIEPFDLSLRLARKAAAQKPNP